MIHLINPLEDKRSVVLELENPVLTLCEKKNRVKSPGVSPIDAKIVIFQEGIDMAPPVHLLMGKWKDKNNGNFVTK